MVEGIAEKDFIFSEFVFGEQAGEDVQEEQTLKVEEATGGTWHATVAGATTAPNAGRRAR